MREPSANRHPKQIAASVGFSFSSLSGPTTPPPPPITVFQPTPPINQPGIVLRPTPVAPVQPAPALGPVALPVFPSQPGGASSASSSSGCGIGGATTNRVVGGLPVRKGEHLSHKLLHSYLNFLFPQVPILGWLLWATLRIAIAIAWNFFAPAA